MTIQISGAGCKELVFVESKVTASAGYTQISRYLEHLAQQCAEGHADRVTLVYVTRDFEADYVEEFARAESVPTGVAFKQARWSEFHRLLLAHTKDNPLAAQLALFMQENRMNLRHQFRSLDLVALENFLSVETLMDETLDGKVRNRFNQQGRDVSKIKKAWEQFADFRRYVLWTTSYPAEHYTCMVGYFLPADEAVGNTDVRLQFFCGPGAPARQQYTDAFHQWCKQADCWRVDGDQWISIVKGRPLASFLTGDDHVEAIRDYMLGPVDEAAAFVAANPHLPWPDDNKTTR